MSTVTDEHPRSKRGRGSYAKQFRTDAAALVIDQHRMIADIARELGVVAQTHGNWVRLERIDRGALEGTTTDIHEDNARLRRELKRIMSERKLLKRSLAFYVSESMPHRDRPGPLSTRPHADNDDRHDDVDTTP